VAERVRRDLSIGHFLREALHALTDVDSALIGTFRALIARPGVLTTEYIYGDRHRFLAPFRVFLFCNVIYFLFASQYHFNALTAPLASQVGTFSYSDVARRSLAEHFHLRAPQSGETPEQFFHRVPPDIVKRYDGATDQLAKTILLVLIPLYAVVIAVLFIGGGRYFAEHLVFATLYVSMYLLALPAAVLCLTGYWWIASYVVRKLPATHFEDILGTLLMVLLGVYVYAAQREFYQSRWWATLARTVVMALSAIPVLMAFKFFLFYVTLYWIG
jgi:hypothetical protein